MKTIPDENLVVFFFQKNEHLQMINKSIQNTIFIIWKNMFLNDNWQPKEKIIQYIMWFITHVEGKCMTTKA